MTKVDCIVVGAGPAGSACAYSLAKKGVETVMIERGRHPGEKNVASFILITQVLERLIPGFREEAPLERAVTDNSYLALGEDDYLQLQSRFYKHAEKGYVYTAFRGKLDAWLADQAVRAGAQLVSGVLVTDLLIEDGRVVGVKAGDDELLADVVVGADGVHSTVARKSGLVKDDPSRYMLGVKEVLYLPPEVIEERFQLKPGEGAIKGGFGYPVDDVGGVFSLYTNRDSLSLAIFGPIEKLKAEKVRLSERLDLLKEHPYINSLIRGSRTREYLSHVIPDGGWIDSRNLYSHGVLLCGEAGGFNTYTWVGVPPGMLSGMMAAETIDLARKKGDYSARTLGSYIDFLNQTRLPDAVFQAGKFSDFMVRSGREKAGPYRMAMMEALEGYSLNELDFMGEEPHPAGKLFYDQVLVDFVPRLLRWPLRLLFSIWALFDRKKKLRRKSHE